MNTEEDERVGRGTSIPSRFQYAKGSTSAHRWICNASSRWCGCATRRGKRSWRTIPHCALDRGRYSSYFHRCVVSWGFRPVYPWSSQTYALESSAALKRHHKYPVLQRPLLLHRWEWPLGRGPRRRRRERSERPQRRDRQEGRERQKGLRRRLSIVGLSPRSSLLTSPTVSRKVLVVAQPCRIQKGVIVSCVKWARYS